MKISKNTVVTVQYVLSDAQGNVIEQGNDPMIYLHGGYESTLPKIEAALDGKESGFKTDIQLEPEDAFGEYDADLVKVEPRSRLPSPLEVGMQFEGLPDDAEADNDSDVELIFTVTDIADDKVVLDGNHPLAGVALRFGLHVTEVRAATEDEIKHEHVHDSYGHHEEEDDSDDDNEDGEYRTHVIH